METMNNISLEAKEETLSLAQRLLLEGKLEEETKIVTNMSKKGLKAEQIADLTEIPLNVVKEIIAKMKN